MEIFSENIEVKKTARYFRLNSFTPGTKFLWYVLHGYGQSASHFLSHFECIAGEDTVFVAPEALSRFYTDGVAGKVGASWMTKEDRSNEIRDYLNYLEQLHQTLAPHLNQETRIILLGFSQGTATAWRWLQKSDIDFSAYINWAGSIPPELNVDQQKKLEKVKIYGVFADQDIYIPVEKIEDEVKKLKTIDQNSTILQFHGKHRMDENTLNVIKSGLEK